MFPWITDDVRSAGRRCRVREMFFCYIVRSSLLPDDMISCDQNNKSKFWSFKIDDLWDVNVILINYNTKREIMVWKVYEYWKMVYNNRSNRCIALKCGPILFSSLSLSSQIKSKSPFLEFIASNVAGWIYYRWKHSNRCSMIVFQWWASNQSPFIVRPGVLILSWSLVSKLFFFWGLLIILKTLLL